MSSRYFALFTLALLLFGCSSQQGPKQVMLSSIEKSASLSSFSSELELNMTTSSSDGAVFSNARVVQYAAGGNSRTDMNISGIDGLEGTEFRVYSGNPGSFVCGKTEKWECLGFNDTIGLQGDNPGGPEWFAERSRRLLEADALQFTEKTERLEISGRGCTQVSATVNYSQVPEDLHPPPGVKSTTITQCLDDETGIALSGTMFTEMETAEGPVLSHFSMQVIRLQVNATVPESFFELPEQ